MLHTSYFSFADVGQTCESRRSNEQGVEVRQGAGMGLLWVQRVVDEELWGQRSEHLEAVLPWFCHVNGLA